MGSFDLFGVAEASGKMIVEGLRCWEVFGLTGYARVDFRVDADGQVFVIDINPNPCIAPDSGFMATARRAGMGHADVTRAIALNPLRRAGHAEHSHV